LGKNGSRMFFGLVWPLAALGCVFLAWWAFSVSAYGYEIDEKGLGAEFRPTDVMLFASAVAFFAAAIILLIIRGRRQRRRHVSSVEHSSSHVATRSPEA